MKYEQKRSIEELSFYSESNSLNSITCNTLQTINPPNNKSDKILIQARDGDIFFSLDNSNISVNEGYKLLQDSDPVLIPQMQRNILKVIGTSSTTKLIYTWGY
jgi:hypothetical protein